jgi:hypothetical protein
MDIQGYRFVCGKTVPRKWGTEYRYTVVSKETGTQYDDVIEIGAKETEKEIAKKIESKLSLLSADIPKPIDPKNEVDEVSVLEYLKIKGVIKVTHTIDQIKSAMSSVAGVPNGK